LLILLGVPPLGGYNYCAPRRAGLSATAGLSCLLFYFTSCAATYKHIPLSCSSAALSLRQVTKVIKTIRFNWSNGASYLPRPVCLSVFCSCDW